ncbi:MAG TPA: hypothetical protein PLG34_13580 [Spirochaetota bacterium]|nr:hypothetical protein [Spirochaetota bacterium]
MIDYRLYDVYYDNKDGRMLIENIFDIDIDVVYSMDLENNYGFIEVRYLDKNCKIKIIKDTTDKFIFILKEVSV